MTVAGRTCVWYNGEVEERAEREHEATGLELEITQVCGVPRRPSARLVGLIARVLETEAWQVSGIHSASHWVAWQCGVSLHAATGRLGIESGNWSHPTGEQFDPYWVHFSEPAG
jgi:hypothetical protein